MTEIDPNVGKEFIEHFGTKGMRWGVRRSREERAKGSGEKEEKEGKKSSSSEPKKVGAKTNTAGKRAENLSDEELKKVVNRMNLEQQYARLNPPPPTVTQRLMRSSSKFALEAARGIAMQQVKAIGNEYATKQVSGLMTARALKGAPLVPNKLDWIRPDINTRVG